MKRPLFMRFPGGLDRALTFSYDDGVSPDKRLVAIFKKYGLKATFNINSDLFSPDDPEKGKNLQMFFYLRSLIESKSPAFLARLGVPEGTKLIPAGMIYVKSAIASGSYVKKEGEAAVTEESVLRGIKQEQRRYGMLLDDAESIRNMNPDFIPITYNKDGSPSKTSARFLYTAQGWERMMGTVSDAVGDVAAKMTSGVRPATPMIEHKENICQYCPYKPICRSAKAK